MELTPDLLLEAKFAPARRGYDMNEVDDFLERCAEGLDVLLSRLKAEFDRAERAGDEVAALQAQLAAAQGGGAVVAPAEEPAAFAAPEPDVAPEPVVAAPEPEPVRAEEPMRILIAAERTAEAAIADARAEAERIRAEAESVASTTRSEAETLLARTQAEAEAEARRTGEETRRAIETEVLALRQDRDALSTDVRSLRRWLDEQRARLRTTARDLQRLIDDPAALRDLPVPELAGESLDDAVAQEPADADSGAPLDDQATGGGPDGGAPGAAQDEMLVLDDGPRIFDDAADDGEPTRAVPVVEGSHGLPDDAVAGFDSGR